MLLKNGDTRVAAAKFASPFSSNSTRTIVLPPRRRNEVKSNQGSESGYSAADELDAKSERERVENLDRLERATQHKNNKTSKSNLG